MTKEELIAFVRSRGLAVLATVAPDGSAQAALVGLAATDRGELVFDTARPSRKLRNLLAHPHVALVIGCDDEVTVQCEGDADVLAGDERERCLDAYLRQYPDGRERARDPEIVHVRVRPRWLRLSDYRAGSAQVAEGRLDA